MNLSAGRLCARLLLPVICMFAWCYPSHAAAPAVLSSENEFLLFTNRLSYLPEGEAVMDADEAERRFKAGEFQNIEDDWLEFGMGKARLWLAGYIRNETTKDELVVEVRNPRISYIDFYVTDADGKRQKFLSGSARDYDVRVIKNPMPSFPVTLEPGEETLVLLRVENVGDMRVQVRLWSASAFFNRISSAYQLEMLVVGVLFVLALFHALVFFSLREPAYLYLSLFILGWMLFVLGVTGIGVMLWGDYHWLALRAVSLFLALMCASFILFTMSFLDSQKYTQNLYRAGLLLVMLWFVLVLIASVADHPIRLYLAQYLTLATILFVVVQVVVAIRRGSRMAKLFLFSWMFVLLGGLALLLLSWYALSARWFIGSSMVNVLFITSILLWSLELTGRIKVRLEEQRRMLEEQVALRTRELQQALSEVKTLSGLLPVCSSCKKIRDDSGYWNSLEQYLGQRTGANFTHGICPECYEDLYPELVERNRKRTAEGQNPA